MIDDFLFFCLSNEDKSFLGNYVSPSRESSTFKSIPVEHKHRVKSLLRQLNFKYRLIYRGPRTQQLVPSFTRAKDATHFSVYAA